MLLYNDSNTAKAAVAVFTFGSQSVTAGTFTLTMPTNDLTTGGFTTTVITGAEVFSAEATIEASTTVRSCGQRLSNHAQFGTPFIFRVRVWTNAATTVQLRSRKSAGTLTPQAWQLHARGLS
jgi:hypothetical protein